MHAGQRLRAARTAAGKKMSDPVKHLDMSRCPESKPEDATASAEEVKLDDPLYKYNARGHRFRLMHKINGCGLRAFPGALGLEASAVMSGTVSLRRRKSSFAFIMLVIRK